MDDDRVLSASAKEVMGESAIQQIEFCRETLRSIQQLIQFLDQKSYLSLVIMGITSAAFFTTVAPVLNKVEAVTSLRFAAVLMAIWFMAEAGIVLWLSLKCIQIVIAKPVAGNSHNMVFPPSLLKHYSGDPQSYFARVRTLNADDILRDYATEIVKTSTIFEEKSRQVNAGINALYRSMLPWLLGMLTSIASRSI